MTALFTVRLAAFKTLAFDEAGLLIAQAKFPPKSMPDDDDDVIAALEHVRENQLLLAAVVRGDIDLLDRDLHPMISPFTTQKQERGHIALDDFVKYVESIRGSVVITEDLAATPVPVVAESASEAPHSTKVRRDTLTPVIELAMSKCRQASDTAEVWAQLQQLAAEKHPPLIGQVEEGLQYRLNGEVKYFTKHALGGRLRRRTQEGPSKPR